MGVVADIADRVLVMYRGEAVETGSVEEIFRPQHPIPKAAGGGPRLGRCAAAILRAADLGAPLAEPKRRTRWWPASRFCRCAIWWRVFRCAAAAQSRDARSACGGEGQF
jgi:hypothetical protein